MDVVRQPRRGNPSHLPIRLCPFPPSFFHPFRKLISSVTNFCQSFEGPFQSHNSLPFFASRHLNRVLQIAVKKIVPGDFFGSRSHLLSVALGVLRSQRDRICTRFSGFFFLLVINASAMNQWGIEMIRNIRDREHEPRR